jgi:hypothetical protein
MIKSATRLQFCADFVLLVAELHALTGSQGLMTMHGNANVLHAKARVAQTGACGKPF